MLTREDMIEIVGDVHFRDWEFNIHEPASDPDHPYLQIEFMQRDATGERTLAPQYGRKWRLSYAMTRSEIVQTCLKAVLTAVEHEAREDFRWKGRAVFSPHFAIERLWEIARERANFDLRESQLVEA